jgi:tight adherence protein B
MNPMLLTLLIFAAVTGLVGALAFMLRGSGRDRMQERLDQLVGRGSTKDSSADILLKQALQEVDRKSLMERLTPEFSRCPRCSSRRMWRSPSVLFGISLALAVAGAFISLLLVNVYVAPVGGLIMFMLPWIWLY